MYLHIGTYSGHIISYQGMIDNFTALHNFQASQSSIRSMARSSKYLLVGGYDELLHIYSIVTNTQQGQINCQQGAINKIRIVGDMFLTGGEDGSICVWKLGTWERVHKSKQHKSVQTMDIHPSGKIMITTGKEKKLIIWNLLKFIRVLDIKLTFDAKKILFHKDLILILSDNSIYQLDTSNNTTIKKTDEKSKIQDGFIYQDYIITSHQNGQIKLYSLDYSLYLNFQSGKNRVKCLGLIELQGNDLLVSADSQGQIKFWHLPSLISKKFDKVQQCVFLIKRVGQRILCISAGMQFEQMDQNQGQLQHNEVQQNQQQYQDEQQYQQQQQQQDKKASKNASKPSITKKIKKNKNHQGDKNNKFNQIKSKQINNHKLNKFNNNKKAEKNKKHQKH